MAGLTVDTGAPIALEKRSPRMSKVWTVAAHDGVEITVPTAVIAEWWRGQRGPTARLVDSVTVEPLSLSLARRAGEALASIGSGPSITDAVVMASAALRGDVVYTGDLEDLQKLQSVFPAVRLLSV